MSQKILERGFYILSIILIAYLTLFSYIEDMKFTTNDDLIHYIATYSGWIELAKATGRVQHYMNGLYIQMTILFSDFIYYRTIHIITILSMIFAFGWLIKLSFRSRYMGYLYMLILSTLWQNSGGHNMIGSYPFYVAFTQLSLLLTIIFQIKYIRNNNKLFLILSIFFWILTIKGSELWILYLPIVMLFSFAESSMSSFYDRVISSVKYSMWHIIFVVISLTIYVWFKHYSSGGYDGSTISIPSYYIVVSAWLEYTFGLFPGLKFYYILQYLGWDYLLSIVDYKIVLVSISLFSFLFFLREKIENIEISSGKYKMIFIISIMALFIPNFLISLTHKYQVWAGGSMIVEYLYSSLSYFVIAFLISMLLFIARRRVYIYTFLIMVIAILSFFTGINNKYIGKLYETDSRKFFTLDAFLHSKYIENLKNDEKISAPEFMKFLKADSELLKEYSKRVVGKEVTFSSVKSSDKYLKFITGDLDKSTPFMIYSQKGVVKAILLSSDRCSSIKPCYLIHSGDPVYADNYLWINSYKDDHNNTIIKNIIKGDWRYRDTVMFEPTDIIKDNQIIAILDYDPSALYIPTIYGIEFLSGLYNWEGEIGEFVWASGDVKIKLTNNYKRKANYRLQMSLGTMKERDVIFSINGKEINRVHLATGERFNKVNFVFELPIGENILDITTDVKAAEPGNGDHRVLSFSMGNINYSIVTSLPK